MKDFAKSIRKIRSDKGYSQDYVAMKLNISTSSYSKIERGQTDPSLSRMKQIAEVLEFDLGEVLMEKPALTIGNTQELNSNEAYGFVMRKEFEESLRLILDLQLKIAQLAEKLEQGG
ncbi:helix-turn-helix domain-containing protein [Aquirufa rosea]|uniref:XRE family transcriptional regulator n=1 Tax=Aquirufa rosea TaxID=2509241 RepID=A0A4Q1BZA3_9BACT|nr:helix-turn-helix transcriptional regulator [Aquirufa rosea]RXK48888.1 XRE family transcriptional regulator [Aquirufa rosea]